MIKTGHPRKNVTVDDRRAILPQINRRSAMEAKHIPHEKFITSLLMRKFGYNPTGDIPAFIAEVATQMAASLVKRDAEAAKAAKKSETESQQS